MYKGAQGRGGRTFAALVDCQWFALLVGISQIAGGFLAGLLERYLTDTAKEDVLVPCPGGPYSSCTPWEVISKRGMGTLMNSLWPRLRLPGCSAVLWPALDGFVQDLVKERSA